MIIIQLHGGLGNQMFQYALGRRASILHNTDLKVFFYNPPHIITPRFYELDVFDLQIHWANSIDLTLMRLFRRYKDFTVKNAFAYDKSVLMNINSSLICGYWQSYKYFDDIEDTIKRDFTFKGSLSGLNKQALNLIQKSSVDSVSIHIRRGDYVSDRQTNLLHGTCTPKYYNNAIEFINRRVKKPRYYIFSDEIDWAKTSLNLPNDTVYVDWNKGARSYIDMQLMSLCKHNIIANSSFSWWGAWLNSNPQKIVVAPKKWFKKDTVDTSDLVPLNWLRI